MVLPNTGDCYYCLEAGHWASNCELQRPAETLAEHKKRFDRIMQRWKDDEIPVEDKRRLIEKENAMWDKQLKKQKTGARN